MFFSATVKATQKEMPEKRLSPGYNVTQEPGRVKDENTKI